MSFQKLTILITGSNQGLGYETARQLSKYPHLHLFLSGRNPERVQQALESILKEDGCQAVLDSVIIDVSDDESIKAAVKEVEAKLGDAALDVLVNNSGIAKEHEVATRGLRTIFQEVFAVNVFGTAVTADAFLPLLKKSKAGPRIVNMSSGLGSIGTMILPDGIYRQAQLLVYNSSKTALNSITCTLAMRNPDLHVVSLDPGWIGTNLNNYAGPGDPKDGVKVMVQHALERTGKSPGFYGNEGEMPW